MTVQVTYLDTLTMSHVLNVAIIVVVSIGLLYITVYLLLLLQRRNKVKKYAEFVNDFYIQQSKPIPILILRIYNEEISQYNKLRNRGIGRIMGFREYSACQNAPTLTSVANTCSK